MQDKKHITLIGCGIFQEELREMIMSGATGLNSLEIDWQEVGLHDNIEKLEEVLDKTVKEHRARGAERIGLLYGTSCLPEMKAFAKARQVACLPVKNCLAALVGDEKLKELEQNRTLVASPGWVRQMWLGRVGTATGWSADDYRMQFGRYDRILLLDPGFDPLTDEEIITCFDLVQVPIEIMECDIEHFKSIFKSFLKSI